MSTKSIETKNVSTAYADEELQLVAQWYKLKLGFPASVSTFDQIIVYVIKNKEKLAGSGLNQQIEDVKDDNLYYEWVHHRIFLPTNIPFCRIKQLVYMKKNINLLINAKKNESNKKNCPNLNKSDNHKYAELVKKIEKLGSFNDKQKELLKEQLLVKEEDVEKNNNDSSSRDFGSEFSSENDIGFDSSGVNEKRDDSKKDDYGSDNSHEENDNNEKRDDSKKDDDGSDNSHEENDDNEKRDDSKKDDDDSDNSHEENDDNEKRDGLENTNYKKLKIKKLKEKDIIDLVADDSDDNDMPTLEINYEPIGSTSDEPSDSFMFHKTECKKHWIHYLNKTNEIQRLESTGTNGYLNDTIIDVFLLFLEKKFKTNKVFVFGSRLEEYLRQFPDNDNPVKKWNKRISDEDLKKVDIFVFPINIKNSHWYFDAVDVRSQKFYVYDSIQCLTKMRMETIKRCRDFLKTFLRHRINKVYQVDKFTIAIANFWKQQNGYDCGVFLLMGIECILDQQELDICQVGGPLDVKFYRNHILELFRLLVTENAAITATHVISSSNIIE